MEASMSQLNQPTEKPIRFALKTLRADLLGNQKRILREHNGFVRYQVFNRIFTLVADAEANQRFLINNLPTYGRSLQHQNLAIGIGDGLICSDGETWRRQRKLTQPAFDKALLMRVVEITS